MRYRSPAVGITLLRGRPLAFATTYEGLPTMMKFPPLRVERRAYDGDLAAYWDATLLRRRSGLLIWHAPPLTPINYPRRGFSSPLRRHELGWVWLARRYTVAVELTPAGGLERAVCRVCLPPTVAGEVVSAVELGLVMTVEPGPVVTVDDEELQEAAGEGRYTPQVRADAWAAIEEARGLLERGEGPFGPDLAKMYAIALRDPSGPGG